MPDEQGIVASQDFERDGWKWVVVWASPSHRPMSLRRSPLPPVSSPGTALGSQSATNGILRVVYMTDGTAWKNCGGRPTSRTKALQFPSGSPGHAGFEFGCQAIVAWCAEGRRQLRSGSAGQADSGWWSSVTLTTDRATMSQQAQCTIIDGRRCSSCGAIDNAPFKLRRGAWWRLPSVHSWHDYKPARQSPACILLGTMRENGRCQFIPI